VDFPLQSTREKGLSSLVEVVVEVPKWSFVKRSQNGIIDFVSPIPCLFNYGSVPIIPAPDGDPLDAIILGKRLPLGHQGIVRVKGIIKFTDAGLVDNKLICTQRKPGMLCV
jgi:inorganic pyrophosphatase